MIQRKDVFQSKVLRKLYPAPSTSEREPSPPSVSEALTKKTNVKRRDNTSAGQKQSAVVPHPRIYTVLPPPADYQPPEGPVSLPLQDSVDCAKDSADECDHEEDKEQEEQTRKKKRRRKRKPALHPDSGAIQTVVEPDRGENMSKNKRRKLKKKRHKEKLHSMGVKPRAAALVFTYQKDGGREEEGEEEEEEDDNERRAAEVSDFLRTTLETYMADSNVDKDKQCPLLSCSMDELLSRVSSGGDETSVLRQLHSLKTLLQHREIDKVDMALQELRDTSGMSAEDGATITSLFQYWITELLPLQGAMTTTPSDCQSP